jgi:hypothetical protein
MAIIARTTKVQKLEVLNVISDLTLVLDGADLYSETIHALETFGLNTKEATQNALNNMIAAMRNSEMEKMAQTILIHALKVSHTL